MGSAKEALQAAIDSLGLTMTAEFVPWSKSRNASRKERSLNWRVTLKRADRAILTTDYGAGVAHCPGYKHGDRSDIQRAIVAYETEHGVAARWSDHMNAPMPRSTSYPKMILPDTCDVIYSLVSDSDVLNCSTFEEWASDLGYDTDSRKAEATYRACLEIALALRNGVGEQGLTLLVEACRDY